MPQLTPPWWAEALTALAFLALAAWLLYAQGEPVERPPTPWMTLPAL